ncbi:MAG: hypothetical protein GXP38_04905 [Chloroflexi bacterium]|nr:hypothetical protein [Chloroflexota bacterium]
MIRLTLLYNLKPYVDEEEFLRWRMAEHQRFILSFPGIIGTDFGHVQGSWPDGVQARYRFMATFDWADRDSFEKGFYDVRFQANLQDKLTVLSDPIFLISEILAHSPEDRGVAEQLSNKGDKGVQLW